MKSIVFKNFEDIKKGLLVTHSFEWVTNPEEEKQLVGWSVVWSRNPYGTYNLILCLWDDVLQEWVAIRHGNIATLLTLWSCNSKMLYRKVVRFLFKHKRFINFRGFAYE